ncbi:MAG: response regulator transcription factor [Myxococcota bacterium]
MLNILLADDSKAIRMQVARVVRELLPDADVLFAQDGAGVLKMWRTAMPPQLTILDIHMPVLNGLEVLRHAAADGVTIPPVIIYTASRDDVLRQQCLEAGAAAVVTKSRENIQDAIRKTLRLETDGSADTGGEP